MTPELTSFFRHTKRNKGLLLCKLELKFCWTNFQRVFYKGRGLAYYATLHGFSWTHAQFLVSKQPHLTYLTFKQQALVASSHYWLEQLLLMKLFNYTLALNRKKTGMNMNDCRVWTRSKTGRHQSSWLELGRYNSLFQLPCSHAYLPTRLTLSQFYSLKNRRSTLPNNIKFFGYKMWKCRLGNVVLDWYSIGYVLKPVLRFLPTLNCRPWKIKCFYPDKRVDFLLTKSYNQTNEWNEIGLVGHVSETEILNSTRVKATQSIIAWTDELYWVRTELTSPLFSKNVSAR